MRALVTGGGGFLGSAIVRALRKRGDEVTSISRGSYPELEALGASTRHVDLTDAGQVLAAVEAARPDVVFHTAARTGIWGGREVYFPTNLNGTRHVLAACLESGVERLVYTSSPSVCFDGRDHLRAQNDLPHARRFQAHYPASKAQAESLALAANGRGSLATCALRPHLIFGPGDPHLLPGVLARAKQGSLRIVGKGHNEVTLTYVENAAHAHLLAAECLTQDAPHAGRAYFIGQEQPVKLWEWINELLARLDLAPIERRVPTAVAKTAGGVLELVWRALGRSEEPRMTRFLAAQLSSSHSYDMQPARRDFGYREQVAMPAALEHTVRDLKARGFG